MSDTGEGTADVEYHVLKSLSDREYGVFIELREGQGGWSVVGDE